MSEPYGQRVLGGSFGRDAQGKPYHELLFRVTVLDTDIFNLSWERYMSWCERNATEIHVALGITNRRKREAAAISLLRGIETRYHQPAFLDDVVRVRSWVEQVGNSSEQFRHQFYRDDTLLLDAHGTLVWVGDDGRPVRVPDWAREAIFPPSPPTPLPSTNVGSAAPQAHSARSPQSPALTSSALASTLGGVFGRNDAGQPYHEMTFRVTALDTDVFNLSWERYLPWAERNATELNRRLGIVNTWLKEQGLGMYMVGFTVSYQQPAYLDDIVTVRSTIEQVSGASMHFLHQFYRDATLLVECRGSLVWVELATQRPTRVPTWARTAVLKTED